MVVTEKLISIKYSDNPEECQGYLRLKVWTNCITETTHFCRMPFTQPFNF